MCCINSKVRRKNFIILFCFFIEKFEGNLMFKFLFIAEPVMAMEAININFYKLSWTGCKT